ncbi:hypothetical protein L6R50_24945 [Myxococcota bacterium]|nr:hypothetical protein [Myxococcota bacterium]
MRLLVLGTVLLAGAGGGGGGGTAVGLGGLGGGGKPPPPLPVLPGGPEAPEDGVARLGSPAFRSPGRTDVLAWAPDGSLLAGGAEGVVRFDASGRAIPLAPHDRVDRVVVGPDGRAWWQDSLYGTWEGESGRRVTPPCDVEAGGAYPVNGVLAAACPDGLRVGDDLKATGDLAGMLAVDPEGRLAVVRSGDRYTPERVRVVDLEAGAVLADEDLAGTFAATCTGGRCLVAGRDGAWAFDGRRGLVRTSYRPDRPVVRVALGPRDLWAAGKVDEVVVFRGRRQECRVEASGAGGLAYSPDGGRLAVGGARVQVLDVARCAWEAEPDPLPEPARLVATPAGWVLVGDAGVLSLDEALGVVRRGDPGLADPDALVAAGDSLWWGIARLPGPPVRVGLSTLSTDRAVGPLEYRLEPLGDVMSGRLPPREPVAVSPDGGTYARGVTELVVGPTDGSAPQPYDLRPFFDPDLQGPERWEEPPPAVVAPPAPVPDETSSTERSRTAGRIGDLGSLDDLLASSTRSPFADTFGDLDVTSVMDEAAASMGRLGGREPRGRKRLKEWRLRAVAVGEGGRYVAFSFDLEFAHDDGDTTSDTFCGILDTAKAAVREFRGLGRATTLRMIPGDRGLVAIDGRVVVFGLDGDERGHAWAPRGRFRAAALSGDGRLLAVGTDRALGLYALDGDGVVLRAHVDTGQGGVEDVAFRGDRLALLGRDGTVLVLDAPRLAARGLLPER